MTQSNRERAILDVWAEDPGAAIAAAAAGALAGSAVTAWLLKEPRLAGDEAPIRVRNGSLEIKLLHSTQEFQEDGSTGRKKWKIAGNLQRGKPEYVVLVLPTDVTCCGNTLLTTGSKVDLVYSQDGLEVEFKATGKRTRIAATNPLDQAQSAKGVLAYAPAGYISAIRIDGTPWCTFGAYDSGLQVILLDI